MDLDRELARFDWEMLQTFTGNARGMPEAIRNLLGAETASEADRCRVLIEETVLMQGALCEACPAVATCLVGGMPSASAPGRAGALDILAQIGSGFQYGPEREAVGQVSVVDCVMAIEQGFQYYCRFLIEGDSIDEQISCIDLVAICGHHDSRKKDIAISVLLDALKLSQLRSVRKLIRASIEDVAGDELKGENPRHGNVSNRCLRSVRRRLVILYAVFGSFSGCVPDGGDQPGGVVLVEAGDGVAEADGDACSEAGR